MTVWELFENVTPTLKDVTAFRKGMTTFLIDMTAHVKVVAALCKSHDSF